MIPKAELKTLEEAVAAVETQGVRLICRHCGALLPGSDFVGTLVQLGYCESCCASNESASAAAKERELRWPSPGAGFREETGPPADT